MKVNPIIGALVATGDAMGVLPICVSNPIELKAGLSLFSMSINTPSSRRCEASVIFDNSDFLPVTFSFPTNCVGPFQASLAIPEGAPNGGAYISWQCSGLSPMCNRVQIAGGQADPNISLQETAQISCMTQSQPTTFTTATRTTTSTLPDDKSNAPRDTQATVGAVVPAITATVTTLPTIGTAANPPGTSTTSSPSNTGITTSSSYTGTATGIPSTWTVAGSSITGTVTHRPAEGVTGTITGEATANSAPPGDTTSGAATSSPDVTTTMITTILVTKTITSMTTLPCTSK